MRLLPPPALPQAVPLPTPRTMSQAPCPTCQPPPPCCLAGRAPGSSLGLLEGYVRCPSEGSQPARSLPLHIRARMGTVVPGAARQRAVPAAWHDFWQLAFIPQPSGLVPWPLAVGDAPKRGSFGTVPRVAMGWERPLTQLLVPSPSALAFTAVDSLQTCFLSPSPRVWVSQAA